PPRRQRKAKRTNELPADPSPAFTQLLTAGSVHGKPGTPDSAPATVLPKYLQKKQRPDDPNHRAARSQERSVTSWPYPSERRHSPYRPAATGPGTGRPGSARPCPGPPWRLASSSPAPCPP